MAMSLYWGVDTAGRVTKTSFKHISNVNQGQPPQFWGRYIGGSYSLTAKEVAVIFGLGNGNCRILLIYNGATGGTVGSASADPRAQGAAEAAQAIRAAKSLGVPLGAGIVIYADIESSWKIDPRWILGWCEQMTASEYANSGGFYCNPLPGNAANFSTPFCTAMNDPSNIDPQTRKQIYKPLFFSSEPENVGCSFDRQSFNPSYPPCSSA